MNLLAVLDALLVVAVAFAGYWLRKLDRSVDGYATAKGTNLATKEDIAEITHKIESVKAELTLNVEVRKVVAARKVEALLKIARLSNPLIGKVLAPKDDVGERIAALDEYWFAVREAEPFADRAALQAATAFGFELQEGLPRVQDIAQMPETYRRAEAARRRLIEEMREELQLEPLREGDVGPAVAAVVRVKGAERSGDEPAKGTK